MRTVLKPLNVVLGTVLTCVPRSQPLLRQQLVTEIFLVWVHGVHQVLCTPPPFRRGTTCFCPSPPFLTSFSPLLHL